jgi:DNA-cytosine methyltransferase
MRIFELFAGIGANSKALRNLGIKHEIVGYSEIDKYASKAFGIINNVPEALNFGDITKIDTDNLPDFDLLTWGFPCQDISVAGKQKGLSQGTRSGLYREGLRILKAKKPKYSIIENVKNLVGKKFKNDFEMILKDLEDLGYTNYWKVLNAKDYGIPQNRERVFIVSVLGEHKKLVWPEPFDNGLRLKDFLEQEVGEKYYIKSDKVQKLLEQLDWNNKEKVCVDMTINEPKFKDVGNCIKARYDAGIVNRRSEGIGVVEEASIKTILLKNKGETFSRNTEIATCLLARDYKGFGNQEMNAVAVPPAEEASIIKVGNTTPSGKSQCNDVISPQGLYPNICAGTHGNCNPSIVEQNIPPTEGTGGGENICVPCLTPDRVEKRQNGRRFKEDGEPMFTLTGQDRHGILTDSNTEGDKPSCNVGGENQKILESNECKRLGNIYGEEFGTGYAGNVWDKDCISPTLMTMQGGGRQPHILEENSDGGENTLKVTKNYIQYDLTGKGHGSQDQRAYYEDGIHGTLPSNGGESKCKVIQNYRIRKLTPKECWRLMAFEDADIQKCIDAGISATQLYKMAGNSIVVNVLEEIYKQLLQII